ncbi:MAG: membrane protein insertion efficiency factor YidD [Candidatus Blackburnbacteria bacterium]|nr:membrane protein insertion efficiency factor YidD [Candidatus Blackburnbacteria bacterium]
MLKKFVCFLIRTYQVILGGRNGFLSFVVGGGCPQSPSCSEYTYQAVGKFGVVKGLKLGTMRIIKCSRSILLWN